MAAAVTRESSATWRVSWSAPSSPFVLVFAGSRPDKLDRFVTVGRQRGAITVHDRRREWFTLIPAHGARLSIIERDLGLASDPNLRDVGGYRTNSGQWVRMGVVYRSAALTLSRADLTTVDGLGIATDYDLRTPAEQRTSPDVVPDGATRLPLNVLGTDSFSAPPLAGPAAAQRFVKQIERQFVTAASAKAAYHTLFTDLATSSGTSLYHCSAGKDRTGWATAVLLTLLGVPERTVMHDYLLSNRYYFETPAVQAQLAAMPPAQATIYRHLLDVEPAYLAAGFAQVRASYGSMYNYAVRGLHLRPATITVLKRKMLVGGLRIR